MYYMELYNYNSLGETNKLFYREIVKVVEDNVFCNG